MKRILLVLLTASLAVSAGCLEPFRAHIDPEVVPPTWERSDSPVHGSVFRGKGVETLYEFDSGEGAPFPAMLLLFSLREISRSGVDDLLRFTRDVVENAAEENGIQLDPGENDSGERQLKNGANTRWFTRAGTGEASDLFASGEEVRIIGEARYDGRSRTSVVVVGMAQVSGEGRLPFQTISDETTWVRIVSDPHGTINEATSAQGFIYNTVSHG